MLDNLSTKMYLYNYYIANGSFANLSKNSPSLYRKILAEKKSSGENELTVTEYLEKKLLTYRPETSLESGYVRRLYEHYRKHSSLTGTEVSKTLENYLNKTAKELNVDLDTVKQMFDNQEIYPEITNKIVNRLDVREYNNVMAIIGLTLLFDMQGNPHLKNEWFTDFDDFKHLKIYEPSYARFLETRVPKYMGPIVGNPDLSIKVEGSRYYGKDLRLETVPSLMDDIFYALQGYTSKKNLTPSLQARLMKMLRANGNFNRIGLDQMNLLRDLDELSMNLGFESIKELLEEDGYKFEPISNERVSIVPCRNNYEVIIEDFHEGQVIIDETLKKYILDMNLLDTLNVVTVPYKGTDVKLLTYEYEGKSYPAHMLITKTGSLNFADGNTLNLVTENLVKA